MKEVIGYGVDGQKIYHDHGSARQKLTQGGGMTHREQARVRTQTIRVIEQLERVQGPATYMKKVSASQRYGKHTTRADRIYEGKI